MNIQIFGKSKSFDTKKAERWFKGVPFHPGGRGQLRRAGGQGLPGV